MSSHVGLLPVVRKKLLSLKLFKAVYMTIYLKVALHVQFTVLENYRMQSGRGAET